MAARSKARVCGRSPAEIVGSNPAEAHGCLSVVCVVRACCVLCVCVCVRARARVCVYLLLGDSDYTIETR